MDWDTLAEIIASASGEERAAGGGSRLAELGRSAAQHDGYVADMKTMRVEWVSVGDYVLVTKFGLPEEHDEDTGRRRAIRTAHSSAGSDAGAGRAPQYPSTVLALNEYPYYLCDGILHFVLWKRTDGPTTDTATATTSDSDSSHTHLITAEETAAAFEQLHAVLGRRCLQLLSWTSPPALRSVPELAHLHILVRTPEYLSGQHSNSSSSSGSGGSSSRLRTTDVDPSHVHLLLPSTARGLSSAAARLRSGGLVAFPTETVYGLGAHALDEAAVLNVFAAKGRPLTDPLIVHVHGRAHADPLMDLTPAELAIFNILASKFWPGPLTLIVKASKKVPPAITAHTGFVGIRVPKHDLALALLAECSIPIAGTPYVSCPMCCVLRAVCCVL